MKYFRLVSSFRPEITYAETNAAPIEAWERKLIWQQENTIHFCINTDADMVIETQDKTIPFNRYDVAAFLPDRNYVLRPSNGKCVAANTLYLIGVEIPKCHYERCDAHRIRSLLDADNKAELLGWVLLPERMHLNGGQYKSAEKMVKSIVDHFANSDASESEYMLCIAKWFELTAVLDQCVRDRVLCQRANSTENRPNVDYYVNKAKNYIEKNYANRITIPMIAKSVGVSPNYLSTVFKEGTGDTIVTYINSVRMLRLRELLQYGDNQSFEDMCCIVGISDERYARRLFKKYFGVSVQYCKQQKEDQC